MSTTHHILSFLRAPAACLAVSVLCALPCRAADLSRQEAEGILQDTHTIAGYMEIAGETDYAAKPDDVIAAALFGAFGGTLGMFAFRHKTKHWYFRLFFPLMLLLQAAILGWLWSREMI